MPPSNTADQLAPLEPARPFRCVAEVEQEMADTRGQAQTYFNLAAEQDRGLNAEERNEVNRLNDYYERLDTTHRDLATRFEKMAEDASRDVAFGQRQQQETRSNRFAISTNLVHNKRDRLERERIVLRRCQPLLDQHSEHPPLQS